VRIRVCGFLAVLCAILHATSAADARAQTYLELISTSFDWAAYTGAPPGDNQRLFVMESRFGNIFTIDLATRVTTGPILHISDIPNPPSSEQGLLGLAFHPDFATNGYFYIYYTGLGNTNYVKRFTMLGDPMTSNVVDLNSVQTVFSYLKAPGPLHNSGWMAFGPNDGYLYITVGDGGNHNDIGPGHTEGTGNAQDLTDNLMGKILRIDVNGDDFPTNPNRNYAIPSSNPFVGIAGDDEIWAYGLRNPWRASFDRAGGDLWIGDVGQGQYEEIDFQPAGSAGGENYGWRLREGPIATPFTGVGGPPPPGNVEPVYSYHHYLGDPNFVGAAVIGGYVYRGPVVALQGHYVFADHLSGNIWKLDPDAVDVRASIMKINERLVPDEGTVGLISSFGEDAAGNLYLTQLYGPGKVFRVNTNSQNAVWKGNNPGSGAAGDGVSWQLAQNWERGGVPDVAFIPEDHVIFSAGSSNPFVLVGSNQTVSAMTFQSPFQLAFGSLRVVSGNISVAAGVTATISSDLSADNANQSLRKMGPGRLIIDGQAGQMVVKEGTLGGNGTLDHLTVRDGATVAPGASAGILTVLNSFTMAPGARLGIEIGGTQNLPNLSPQFDQILVGGAAKLDGILSVSLIDLGAGTFEPIVGDYVPILTSVGNISGSFDTTNLPELPAVLEWRLNYFANNVYLSVVPAVVGDYNADGIVNAGDYVAWRNTSGQTGWNLAADGSGPGGVPDGIVDRWDYIYWKSNFGNTLESQGSGALVPEPSSLPLGIFAAVTCLKMRRKRR
jgi:glucose/arabinose dehydrogenase